MKKALFIALVAIQTLNAQISVPYTTNFDSPTSDENWTHSAITGTDDWERGLASGTTGTNDFSWETNIGGVPSINSNMVLESPAFDLTNANLPYVLSFKHKRNLSSGNFYVEYTTDGANWLLLNPATNLKKNWQATTGFTLAAANFVVSAINLSFLQGNSNVKFRFRCKTNATATGFGWVVDDFSIAPEAYNLNGIHGEPVEISLFCPQLKINTGFELNNQYTQGLAIESKYYFSSDMIWDASDLLLYSYTTTTSGSVPSITQTLPTPSGLTPGQYYVLVKLSFESGLAETTLADNIAVVQVNVKGVTNLPYATDFETDDSQWTPKTVAMTAEELKWERGLGRRHHIEGAHSGVNAWHTSKTITEHAVNATQCVMSPYFNISGASEPVILSFWYKVNGSAASGETVGLVQYSIDCNEYWTSMGGIGINNQSDGWEVKNIFLNSTIAASSNVRFRILYQNNYTDPEGIVFDDFYLGPIKPDFAIEKIFSNKRFTSTGSQSDALKYEIRNCGGEAPQDFSTRFYWSTDAVLDGGDLLLGEKVTTSLIANGIGQWEIFTYNKPTLAAGNYYIIYSIDPTNQILEIRENDNIGAIPIEQLPTIAFPYYNDFETQTDNWIHDATLGVDEWAHAEPQKAILNTAFSGAKGWITNPTGPVTSMSRMHLYTPAFDLTTSEHPVLEFDMLLDYTSSLSTYAVMANLSYSTDNGASWTVLVPVNESYTKWQKRVAYDENTGLDAVTSSFYTEKMFALNEPAFTDFATTNGRDVDRNTKYLIDITHLKDESNIRFRFNISSQLNDFALTNSVPQEGVFIDNFQIREGEIDLSVPYIKNLYLNDLATKLKFSIDVKNSGNYISNATDVKFYLSNDAAYNSGDHYLGSLALGAIRPDFKSYKNLEFSLPANLSDYAYLVYVIDDSNANTETSETNNYGAWPLGLAGITNYPYFENFEGDVIDGWHGYAYQTFSSNVLDNYRVSNKVALGRDFYTSVALRNYNGILRTDNAPYGSWQASGTPMYYILSPTFDFTTYNSTEPLIMAFNCMSVGGNFVNGSNMQYSIDGGATWIMLTNTSGPSFNWYQNFQTMSDFSGQTGWFWQNAEIKTIKMNISFLQSQPNVMFRFRYYSNFATASSAPRGFRLDNFSIGQETLVNELNCIQSIPYFSDFDDDGMTCWETGTNDDEIILLDRTSVPDIHWEPATNFADVSNNPSFKIDMTGQGNTAGTWLISPNFNMITGNKLRFVVALTQFQSLASATLGSDDQIKLMYSANNGLTWTDLKVWNATSVISNTSQEVLINSLPTTGYAKFAFMATNGATNNGNNSTFYVDNFQLYTGSLGLSQHDSLELNYYPNPVKDLLILSSQSEKVETVKIYTISGQLLEEKKINGNEFSLDFTAYSNGVYFVELKTADKSKTIKILKY